MTIAEQHVELDTPHLDRLDRSFAQQLCSDLCDTIQPPHHEDLNARQDRNDVIVHLLEAFAPADPVEAMLATHIIASHYQAIACMRAAATLTDGSREAQRERNAARAFQRSMESLLRMFRREQGRAAEPSRPSRASPPAHPHAQRDQPSTPARSPATPELPGATPGPAEAVKPAQNPETASHEPKAADQHPGSIVVKLPPRRQKAPRPQPPAERAPLPPRWETLTPAQRRELYGYTVPDDYLRSAPQEILDEYGLQRPSDNPET